ncbi:hypothetical protein FisN_1Hh421 [Fistulifera solaris]|uniref:Elongator complex protein 4 n=1 Tax=Fistulifera solaris TaxID=1519565 RepID=A0A1Z5JJR4_FISSO|nr:hypothetical protein FisN_1Hh421 [Fistulifera solaris]|eukprot:GAX14229.1 hypothetical protein FisN_1Hh421 [Fistulifera solaris]
MSSTFKRRNTSNNQIFQQLEGTRPTTTPGITFTSTGLRDLDQVLSGGQPLTTCIWLEEDRWTCSLARCLVQYWCAEALSQNQLVIVPVESDDGESSLLGPISWCADEREQLEAQSPPVSFLKQVKDLLAALPRNLNKDKDIKQQKMSGDDPAEVLLETLEEEEEDENNDEAPDAADDGLKIAWQYKESVQRERRGHTDASRGVPSPRSSPSGNVFCHSYDLQGRLSNQLDTEQNVLFPEIQFRCLGCSYPRQCCGFAYYRSLKDQLQSLPTTKVQRLLLYHPDLSVLQTALPLLVSFIRSKKLPVVVMIVVQPWTTSVSTNVLRRTSDFVLAAESFVSRQQYPPPPEFQRFHGLLQVVKSAHKRPISNIYGLKRDRRKLLIELLHIPPEDYAAKGGSTGSGVRSGAGRPSSGLGCSSSGSALDF